MGNNNSSPADTPRSDMHVDKRKKKKPAKVQRTMPREDDGLVVTAPVPAPVPTPATAAPMPTPLPPPAPEPPVFVAPRNRIITLTHAKVVSMTEEQVESALEECCFLEKALRRNKALLEQRRDLDEAIDKIADGIPGSVSSVLPSIMPYDSPLISRSEFQPRVKEEDRWSRSSSASSRSNSRSPSPSRGRKRTRGHNRGSRSSSRSPDPAYDEEEENKEKKKAKKAKAKAKAAKEEAEKAKAEAARIQMEAALRAQTESMRIELAKREAVEAAKPRRGKNTKVICLFTLEDGKRCKGTAIDGEKYCYRHHTDGPMQERQRLDALHTRPSHFRNTSRNSEESTST